MNSPATTRTRLGLSNISNRIGQALALTGGVLFIALVWGLVAYHLDRARTEIVRQAETDAINLSIAMSEQVSRLIEGADQTMRMIAIAYQTEGAAFDFERWASAATGLEESAANLTLVDANGDLVASRSTPKSLLPSINAADRAYFMALKANRNLGLYVDKTMRTRMPGNAYVFQIARRVEHADGSFAGVIVVSLNPDYLADKFDDVDIGVGGNVSLFGTDGGLRARYPEVPGMFETVVPRNATHAGLLESLSGSIKGSFQVASTYDGVYRLYGYKALPHLPLVVTIGKSFETIMLPYYAERTRAVTMASAATLAALLFLAASLYEIELRHRRERSLAIAHEATAAAEARYRLLAENATDMIVRLDPDARRTYVSPASKDLLGMDPSQLTGSSPLMGIHPQDHGPLTAVVASLRSGVRDNAVSTHRLRHADGRWVWVEASWRVLRDASGSLAGYIASVRDVDDRQKAMEDLKASRLALVDKTELLELAQTAAGAGSWDFDLLTGKVVLSPESARLHGLADVEAVMTIDDWKALCLPGDAERTIEGIDLATVRHETMRTEFRVPMPDGSVRWVVGIGRAHYDDAGKPTRMIGLNLDVTARKESETALLNAKAEAEAARASAEQASAAKTDFLASMSHEVRTPLNAVIGYTGLLAESDRLDPDLRRHAELARSAGSALLMVVNDILDFSKIEAGQVEMHPGPFMTHAMLDNCLSIVRGSASSKPVEVRSASDDALPDCLVGDEGRLRQVLLNLLNNAVKFTKSGNVTLNVRHQGSTSKGELVRFSVTDTGIGIPRDRQHRLFQRFSQVDGSVSRDYGGTGLGLAICKGLVETMGGEIGVFSEPGRGSTFWFTVTLPRGSVPKAMPLVANPGAISGRLLLVEDVEVNQELARLILEMAGHEVEVVADGRSAVEAVRGGGFDLVLMDVQMPGMDGMEATQLIRALDGPERDVPIVAMTANVLPDEVAAFRESGMDDHVGKPFDRNVLYATIERWLARKGTTSFAAHRARAANG